MDKMIFGEFICAISFSCPECKDENDQPVAIGLEVFGINTEFQHVFLGICPKCKTKLRYTLAKMKEEVTLPMVVREPRAVM